MPNYNPGKLTRELEAAGIPVESVTTSGRISYSRRLSEEEKATAEAIIAAHDPYDRAAALRRAYMRAGIDAEVLINALWAKIMEGDDATAADIQRKRLEIQGEVQ